MYNCVLFLPTNSGLAMTLCRTVRSVSRRPILLVPIIHLYLCLARPRRPHARARRTDTFPLFSRPLLRGNPGAAWRARPPPLSRPGR